jgi:hypothetical protein
MTPTPEQIDATVTRLLGECWTKIELAHARSVAEAIRDGREPWFIDFLREEFQRYVSQDFPTLRAELREMIQRAIANGDL